MIPAPESRSGPAASMSSAVDSMVCRSWRVVNEAPPPAASRISAATAAAWGAAAEVPKKGLKPGVDVITPSAAVMSGFCLRTPPVDEKPLPGFNSMPSSSKNTRRGPSELNVSIDSVPSKTPPAPPGGSDPKIEQLRAPPQE